MTSAAMYLGIAVETPARATEGATRKILKYQMRDVLRSRWLIVYALFFLLVTDGLLRFSGDPVKAQLSLINVVLFIVPLVTVVFGTVYLYHAREFIELLLAQPVHRRQMYAGLYLGLTIPLALAVVIGLGVPFFLHGMLGIAGGSLAALLLAGVVLTCVFAAIALLITSWAEDRLRGLGVAIGAWLTLTVLYDGLVLFLLVVLSEYPIERATLALMMMNPIDIIRVALLVHFDGAALMGYTGAVFQHFFSGFEGAAITVAALILWVSVPVLLGAHAFQRKDF